MSILFFVSVVHAADLSELSAGDLVVTELMTDPTAVVWYRGEWLEIYNASGDEVDLDGLEVTDGSGGGFTVSGTLTVGAGEYALLAARESSTANGGLPTVDVAYDRSDLPLYVGNGTVTLEHDGVIFDSVSWDDGFSKQSGRSMSLSSDALSASDNDSAVSWCVGRSTYGDGDYGTPGDANASCTVSLSSFEAGDLLITEVLHTPDQSDDGKGDWFEIHNNTEVHVDLDGLVITDSGTDAMVISGELVLLSGGYAVVAARDVPSKNGNLPRVDYRYLINTELVLRRIDDLSLSYGAVTFDEVSWSDRRVGISKALDGTSYDGLLNDTDDYWCDATDTYGDGDYGTPGTENAACALDIDGDGHSVFDDCDDGDADSYPGATERCDRIDNDCDGTVDEGTSSSEVWYADADGDGYGDVGTTYTGCDVPSGYVYDNTDCDDTRADASPAGTEICDDIDNDCDGTADVGAVDTPTWYADTDDDKYGDPAVSVVDCDRPYKYRANGLDCDDADEDTNPGADDICENGIDDDCDGDDPVCYPRDRDDAVTLSTGLSYASNVRFYSSWNYPRNFGAADFNGDGVDDLWADYDYDDADDVDGDGVTSLGRAVIFYGPITSDVHLEDADLVAASSTLMNAGSSIFRHSHGGDIDGDGYDDLLIGSYEIDVDENGEYDPSSYTGTGGIFVFYGPLTGELSSADADDQITSSSHPGYSIEPIEVYDYDNDGRVELFAEIAQDYETADLYDDDWTDHTAEFDIRHGEWSGTFNDPSLAGDLDGDGYGDVISTNDGYTSSTDHYGSTMVFYGPLSGTYSGGHADEEITGSSLYEIGAEAAPLGDINGDGYDDVMMQGRADLFIFHGPLTSSMTTGDAESTVTVEIDSTFDAYLAEFGLAGDLDGDGEEDIYLMPSTIDDGRMVAIGYGPLSGTVTVSHDDRQFYVDGYGGDSHLVDGAGDLDDDGRDDLIVRSWADDTFNNEELYIVFGDSL